MLRVIAIDGTAGSGKSSVAKTVAKRLGWAHLDSGAIYRTLTLALLTNSLNYKSSEAIDFLKQCQMEFNERITLNGKDVYQDIRTENVSKQASTVAAIPEIRKLVFERQRKVAEKGNVVMDGRDTGNVVVPDAGLKIFIDADPMERAKRRMKQLGASNLLEIYANIIERDRQDKERKASPLKAAPDAILIDSTNKTQKEIQDYIVNLAESVFMKK